MAVSKVAWWAEKKAVKWVASKAGPKADKKVAHLVAQLGHLLVEH